MVLPLIPLVAIAVGAAAGGGGLALGGKGAFDITKANAELSASRERYEARRTQSEEFIRAVNDRIVTYGAQQEHSLTTVVRRMHDFLIRNEKQVRDSEKLLTDGLDAQINLLTGSGQLDLSISQWVRGVIGSVGAGAGVGAATTSAVSSLGVASTGAAISGLSGAAAESATLAWLGGGALAAGGGGVALGALALNFVTFGPGLLAAGFVVKGQGKKAETQAKKFGAEIEVAIANLDVADVEMEAVRTRTDELADALSTMSLRATAALDVLEADPFDAAIHAAQFQKTMVLVKGVVDIATTPVIDEEGSLTDAGYRLIVKYRPAENARASDPSPQDQPGPRTNTDVSPESVDASCGTAHA